MKFGFLCYTDVKLGPLSYTGVIHCLFVPYGVKLESCFIWVQNVVYFVYMDVKRGFFTLG